jgi:iron complex outermembrane receptor protein
MVEGGSVKQTILAGVEYSHTRMDTIRVSYNLSTIADIYNPVYDENSLDGMDPQASQFFDRQLTMTDLGIYLQDQFEFGDHFKARIGLRSDDVDARDEGIQGLTSGATPAPKFRIIDVEDRLNSGTLGLVWQPTKDYSFYAGMSTGKFVNLATEATALPAEAEESLQKEVGVKAIFLNGKLDANLAVFDTKRDNYFVTLPSSSDPVPEGEDTTQGVDIDLGARPFEGYSILANLIVQDPKNESENVVTNSALNVTDTVAGKRPTAVAKRQVRLWNEYVFQQPALKGWGTGLGVTYKGNTYADALNLYEVPSYTVWDASVFYRTKQWEAILSVRNLGDKTYYTTPTFAGALPGEERNALLSVRWFVGGDK